MCVLGPIWSRSLRRVAIVVVIELQRVLVDLDQSFLSAGLREILDDCREVEQVLFMVDLDGVDLDDDACAAGMVQFC